MTPTDLPEAPGRISKGSVDDTFGAFGKNVTTILFPVPPPGCSSLRPSCRQRGLSLHQRERGVRGVPQDGTNANFLLEALPGHSPSWVDGSSLLHVQSSRGSGGHYFLLLGPALFACRHPPSQRPSRAARRSALPSQPLVIHGSPCWTPIKLPNWTSRPN